MKQDHAPNGGDGAGRDVLLRAMLPTHGVRVVTAVTTGVAREATRRHGAVGGPAAALGRAVTAGALLATITKDRERVTAELSGGGPLGAIIIDANAAGEIRAFIKNPAVAMSVLPGAHVPLGQAMGAEGVVRVARDLGLRETVNGQTSMRDGEIDTDLEHYLCTSEQVPSVLTCDALLGPGLDVAVAAGVLLQTLPGSQALPLLEELRAAVRAGALTRALAAANAGMPDALEPATIARAVLGDVAPDLVLLDERPLRFHCPCSKQRALATMGVLSLQDLTEMVAEGRGAEVTCEFCRARHVISPAELEHIRAEARGERPS